MSIKKIFLISLSLSLCFMSFSVQTKQPRKIKTMTKVKGLINKQVKNKNFEKILRKFVGCCRPSRMVGSKGHQKVIPYLSKVIESLDPENTGTVTIHRFKPDVEHAIKQYQNDFDKEIAAKLKPNDAVFKKWDGFTKNMISTISSLKNLQGKNLIWEKKGKSSDEILIVGAHYDTIANDKKTLLITPEVAQPGADDNASGVAVALGIISLLAKIDLDKTVRVIFWDFEEVGFLGSRAYVQNHLKQLKSENIIGNLNLEMLGNDSTRNDKNGRKGNMKVYTRKPSIKDYLQDMKLANLMTDLGKKITKSVTFSIVPNGFNSSDHINFWAVGIPAITYTQNWEDDFNHARYHTANDFVETLNMRTLYNSFRHIAGAVMGYSLGISP